MLNSILSLWSAVLRKELSEGRQEVAGAFHPVGLDQVVAGQKVQVVEIVAGQMATRQLAQLSIRPGSRLVVQRRAPMGGPVLVESAGSTVAIGRGMARKVSVKILK